MSLYYLMHSDASWMHSRTSDISSRLTHIENRYDTLRIEGRISLSWNLRFFRIYFDVNQHYGIAQKRERASEREGERESVCGEGGGGEEEEERKIVIVNPSIGNVANEEVYTKCLDVQYNSSSYGTSLRDGTGYTSVSRVSIHFRNLSIALIRKQHLPLS